jgi:hypothetical protein
MVWVSGVLLFQLCCFGNPIGKDRGVSGLQLVFHQPQVIGYMSGFIGPPNAPYPSVFWSCYG